MQDVLVLNTDGSPLQIIAWERAVWLLLEEKVLLVAQRAGKWVRSASRQIPWPSVVALKTYVRQRGEVRFKRPNVYARDGFACCYCGRRPQHRDGSPDLRRLTLDHVVPRARSFEVRRGRSTSVMVTLPWSGRDVPVTSWENVVTACERCNTAKADRTPEEAGMRPVRPKRPNAWDGMRIVLGRLDVPNEWTDHIG